MFDFLDLEPADLPQHRPLIVDSFAGGGGASTGIAQALGRHPDVAINHDELALSMHKANHPGTKHLITSVYAVDPRELLSRGQKVGLLWASPDCTHFSRARGSRPKDKNIRDLAWVVVHWAELVAPDVILLENVAEFETWEDYEPWKAALRKHGYKMQFRLLKASDYGAPTIRTRLFMVARRDGKKIVWPEPTHGDPKTPAVAKGKLKPWRTAGECIDWSIPMPSIFDTSEQIKAEMGIRASRPLADNTQRRIAAGVKRYILDAQEPYFISYAQQGGANRSASQPMHTICASRKDQNQLVAAKIKHVAAFMAQHNGGVIGREMDAPLSTLTTRGTQQAIVAANLIQFYGANPKDGHERARTLAEPLATVTTKDRHALVAAHMMNMRGSGPAGNYSPAEPCRTITSQGNHAALVAAFLVKWYGSSLTANLHEPCHTLTTKDRFAVVTVQINGETYIITDICMRLLTPREQFTAQGFPADYEIERGHDGRRLSKTEQTHKCGNSVSPPVARALAAANCPELAEVAP